MAATSLTVPIVINRCHGAFSLTSEAAQRILQRKGLTFRLEASLSSGTYPYIGTGWQTAIDVCSRNDPDLIAVVQEMGGEAAGGSGTRLEIHVIELSITIDDYDGMETVQIAGGSYH
jgi:hypothetical protein